MVRLSRLFNWSSVLACSKGVFSLKVKGMFGMWVLRALWHPRI